MDELEDMIEADDLEWSEQGFSLLDAYRRWNAENIWTDREEQPVTQADIDMVNVATSYSTGGDEVRASFEDD